MDAATIRKELRRCQEAVRSGETLLEERLCQETISRAYYAVLQGAMLILSEPGTLIRDPVEVERRFTADLVRERNLPPELHELFATVRFARKADPHNFLFQFSPEEAGKTLEQARRFVKIVMEHFETAAS